MTLWLAYLLLLNVYTFCFQTCLKEIMASIQEAVVLLRGLGKSSSAEGNKEDKQRAPSQAVSENVSNVDTQRSDRQLHASVLDLHNELQQLAIPEEGGLPSSRSQCE